MDAPSLSAFHVVEILGFYIPPALLWACAALPIFLFARWIMRRFGLYRYIWRPALFNLALYVLILASVIFLRNGEWL